MVLKNFFVLLLFSLVALSLGDEVLDKIQTLEERVHNLETTNLELVTAVQSLDINLREAQEQLNVSTSANNLVHQKIEDLEDMDVENNSTIESQLYNLHQKENTISQSVDERLNKLEVNMQFRSIRII